MILVCVHCAGRFRVKSDELEPGPFALVCPMCGKRIVARIPGGPPPGTAAVASRPREPAPRALPLRAEKAVDRETAARAAIDDLLKPIAARRPVPTRPPPAAPPRASGAGWP